MHNGLHSIHELDSCMTSDHVPPSIHGKITSGQTLPKVSFRGLISLISGLCGIIKGWFFLIGMSHLLVRTRVGEAEVSGSTSSHLELQLCCG